MRSPNTREVIVNAFKYSNDAKGDKESPKDCSHLKSCVVNAFTRALAPPFIGRRMDFYIPKIPLGPKEYS
jgi:hypothetical protein